MNIVEELRALVGHNGVLEAADVATRSAGAYRPDNLKAMALVRPANTDEVAAVMRWCHAHGVRRGYPGRTDRPGAWGRRQRG